MAKKRDQNKKALTPANNKNHVRAVNPHQSHMKPKLNSNERLKFNSKTDTFTVPVRRSYRTLANQLKNGTFDKDKAWQHHKIAMSTHVTYEPIQDDPHIQHVMQKTFVGANIPVGNTPYKIQGKYTKYDEKPTSTIDASQIHSAKGNKQQKSTMNKLSTPSDLKKSMNNPTITGLVTAKTNSSASQKPTTQSRSTPTIHISVSKLSSADMSASSTKPKSEISSIPSSSSATKEQSKSAQPASTSASESSSSSAKPSSSASQSGMTPDESVSLMIKQVEEGKPLDKVESMNTQQLSQSTSAYEQSVQNSRASYAESSEAKSASVAASISNSSAAKVRSHTVKGKNGKVRQRINFVTSGSNKNSKSSSADNTTIVLPHLNSFSVTSSGDVVNYQRNGSSKSMKSKTYNLHEQSTSASSSASAAKSSSSSTQPSASARSKESSSVSSSASESTESSASTSVSSKASNSVKVQASSSKSSLTYTSGNVDESSHQATDLYTMINSETSASVSASKNANSKSSSKIGFFGHIRNLFGGRRKKKSAAARSAESESAASVSSSSSKSAAHSASASSKASSSASHRSSASSETKHTAQSAKSNISSSASSSESQSKNTSSEKSSMSVSSARPSVSSSASSSSIHIGIVNFPQGENGKEMLSQAEHVYNPNSASAHSAESSSISSNSNESSISSTESKSSESSVQSTSESSSSASVSKTVQSESSIRVLNLNWAVAKQSEAKTSSASPAVHIPSLSAQQSSKSSGTASSGSVSNNSSAVASSRSISSSKSTIQSSSASKSNTFTALERQAYKNRIKKIKADARKHAEKETAKLRRNLRQHTAAQRIRQHSQENHLTKRANVLNTSASSIASARRSITAQLANLNGSWAKSHAASMSRSSASASKASSEEIDKIRSSFKAKYQTSYNHVEAKLNQRHQQDVKNMKHYRSNAVDVNHQLAELTQKSQTLQNSYDETSAQKSTFSTRADALKKQISRNSIQYSKASSAATKTFHDKLAHSKAHYSNLAKANHSKDYTKIKKLNHQLKASINKAAKADKHAHKIQKKWKQAQKSLNIEKKGNNSKIRHIKNKLMILQHQQSSGKTAQVKAVRLQKALKIALKKQIQAKGRLQKAQGLVSSEKTKTQQIIAAARKQARQASAAARQVRLHSNQQIRRVNSKNKQLTRINHSNSKILQLTAKNTSKYHALKLSHKNEVAKIRRDDQAKINQLLSNYKHLWDVYQHGQHDVKHVEMIKLKYRKAYSLAHGYEVENKQGRQKNVRLQKTIKNQLHDNKQNINKLKEYYSGHHRDDQDQIRLLRGKIHNLNDSIAIKNKQIKINERSIQRYKDIHLGIDPNNDPLANGDIDKENAESKPVDINQYKPSHHFSQPGQQLDTSNTAQYQHRQPSRVNRDRDNSKFFGLKKIFHIHQKYHSASDYYQKAEVDQDVKYIMFIRPYTLHQPSGETTTFHRGAKIRQYGVIHGATSERYATSFLIKNDNTVPALKSLVSLVR